MISKEELSDDYLTEREYNDYVKLFRFAADRVLAKHTQMREEVHRMTEPLIKLPSVIMDELDAKLQSPLPSGHRIVCLLAEGFNID